MKFIRVIQAIESLGVAIIGTAILRVNFVSCNFFYSVNRHAIHREEQKVICTTSTHCVVVFSIKYGRNCISTKIAGR